MGVWTSPYRRSRSSISYLLAGPHPYLGKTRQGQERNVKKCRFGCGKLVVDEANRLLGKDLRKPMWIRNKREKVDFVR